jgi:hypothetical protein
MFGGAMLEMGDIIDFIPAGCTSIAQPLDVAVMKLCKTAVERLEDNQHR